MKELIELLEKQQRHTNREVAYWQRYMEQALDVDHQIISDTYDTLRHYHVGKKEVLDLVIHELKKLEA